MSFLTRPACRSQPQSAPLFCTHPVASYSPLTHLFVLYMLCIYLERGNCIFQGGVCHYNFLMLSNIPPDQIACTDEQVYDIREESTYNQLSYNGNGESKCMLLFRYLYQINLFYSCLDYEVKSVSLRMFATISDSLRDLKRPHVKL